MDQEGRYEQCTQPSGRVIQPLKDASHGASLHTGWSWIARQITLSGCILFPVSCTVSSVHCGSYFSQSRATDRPTTAADGSWPTKHRLVLEYPPLRCCGQQGETSCLLHKARMTATLESRTYLCAVARIVCLTSICVVCMIVCSSRSLAKPKQRKPPTPRTAAGAVPKPGSAAGTRRTIDEDKTPGDGIAFMRRKASSGGGGGGVD